jgi:hypothetical protein
MKNKVGKRFTIRIDIPASIWRYRYENIRKYVRAKLKPARCSDCGVKMNFKHAQYEMHNPRLIVQRCSGTVCPACMEKEIHDIIAANNVSMDDTHEVCDVCHSHATSFKSIHRAVSRDENTHEFMHRYYHCVNSWNSGHVCVSCMIDAIRNGKETSSVYTYDNETGKSHPTNEYGCPVIDGKVRFPLI